MTFEIREWIGIDLSLLGAPCRAVYTIHFGQRRQLTYDWQCIIPDVDPKRDVLPIDEMRRQAIAAIGRIPWLRRAPIEKRFVFRNVSV